MPRHPDISVRTSELVTPAGAFISQNDIKKWFNDGYKYLKEDLSYVLNVPTSIVNGDESGFT